MPAPASSHTLARSRSRYKGARRTQERGDFEALPSSAKPNFQYVPERAIQTQERQYVDIGAPTAKSNQPSYTFDGTVQTTSRQSKTKNEIADNESLGAGAQERRRTNEGSGSPLIKGNLPMRERRSSERRIEPVPEQRLTERLDHTSIGNNPPHPSRQGPAQRIVGHRTWKNKEELKRAISGPMAIEPPQTTILPAFDAPVSAVNAGERHVRVQCGQSTLSLPVTPTTTSLDLVRLTAEQYCELGSGKHAVVVESFKQLALERPLRLYEHIRDVLNSWDSDNQNTLMITSSENNGIDHGLNLESGTELLPKEVSVMMYHSSRPRRWNKRSIKLCIDGQIVINNKEGAENVCHLSDFDVYVPTARQLSKRIKPPRKLCFAIKSQQKSSMFMSTVNFVHFFSTSDKTTASTWYKAVYEWRSWYLFHIMGKGQRKHTVTTQKPANGECKAFDSSRIEKSNRSRAIPSGSQHATTAVIQDHPMAGTVRRRGNPPSSYPNRLNVAKEPSAPISRQTPTSTQAASAESTGLDTFAPGGLLGRTYTQRKKAQQMREAAHNPDEVPLPPASLPQNPANALKRSSSQRQGPRPLVDLTPQYREAPQHARKGKGFIPEQIPAGGLVEIATSPEAALEVPPATVWQRPKTNSGNDGTVQRSCTVRVDKSQGSSAAPRLRQASTSPDKGGFTGGLVAGNEGQTRSSIGIGKSARTGDREATEPLLNNMSPQNDYAPGSLLEQVGRRDGNAKPTDNRERRKVSNA